MSYLNSTSRLARASRSSGLLGGLLTRASSIGSTIPWPMKCDQTRFARLRANAGFSGEASQSASDWR